MQTMNLEQIDDVIKRTNCDYQTAKSALEYAEGDVLEAIIYIENTNKTKTQSSSMSNKGEQILNQMKDVISKGNATKLTIKKNNDVIINVPITAGILGALIAPFLSAAGITAALLTQCSVEITQADGKVIDINQKVDQGVDVVMDKMQGVKTSAENLTNNIKENFNNTDDNDY